MTDQEKAEAFEDDLEQLCERHGVVFNHEDYQGVGYIYDAEAAGELPGCNITVRFRKGPPR